MLKINPPNYIFCPFCSKKLSIVNVEDGRKRKSCRFCHWTHYPHVGAAATAVIIRGKKVLMVQRAEEPYKDTWMFPAGFIEYGEHPMDALKREVKEETNLTVIKARLMDVFQSGDDPRSPGHFVFFYKAAVSKGKPKIGWKTHKHIMRLLQQGLWGRKLDL